MTRGRIFRRGRAWWISFYYRGRETRESVCMLLGTKRATKADARRCLAARLAQLAGEPGAEPAGARLGPSERLLARRTLETVIQLAQTALTRLKAG